MSRKYDFNEKGELWRGNNTSEYLHRPFDISRRTKVAMISNGEVITDVEPTNGCVRVMTSDGVVGTLSHLDISHNPTTFAASLKKVAGYGAAVILNGGENESYFSGALIGGLFRALKNEGFKVAPLEDENCNDVDGYFARTATLSKNGAEVVRTNGTKKETIRLKFPR